MSNLNNYMPSRITHPGLLGRNTFDDVFEKLFHESFPALLKQSTRGYPVADIYQQDGDTVMEFALAGFTKEDLLTNLKVLYETIEKNKPSGAKGRYWKSFYITSTMGPSIEVDFGALQDSKEEK